MAGRPAPSYGIAGGCGIADVNELKSSELDISGGRGLPIFGERRGQARAQVRREGVEGRGRNGGAGDDRLTAAVDIECTAAVVANCSLLLT
jgi:hypothetical protein